MNPLVVEPFKNQDLNAVLQLIATSFQSKFETMVSLSNAQIISLLNDTWHLRENNPTNGHFVAKVGDKIAGVILLKYASQDRIDDRNVGFFKLAKTYGLKNTTKYLIGMSLLDHQLLAHECYIEHIAIDPAYRGMGIGTVLIHHAKEFARTLPDITHYSLNVAGSNVNAYKLYKRLQFAEVEDKTINSHFMQWLVGEKKWLYMTQALIHHPK